ncbi:GNAT family N-acetyltransferase [Acrocarpospora catenulata]|uniref:GNAT family N-acetyltransferase n=1 Tax=Acrocarpospora catenulata TaxID=2836182 RepID=UPI001BDB50E9|nr:GNAT family N-acetyltransferase [Acrocarpospora catenulata]
MVIRLAERDDVPTIVALLNDDAVSRSRGVVDGTTDDHWAAFDAITEDPNNELVVAELGGVIVGTMQLTYLPGLSRNGAWRLQVEAVRVAEAHRGKGLGRTMIDWAIERGRARGCALVQLTSDKQRVDAHRFYVALGFAASHEGFKLKLN